MASISAIHPRAIIGKLVPPQSANNWFGDNRKQDVLCSIYQEKDATTEEEKKYYTSHSKVDDVSGACEEVPLRLRPSDYCIWTKPWDRIALGGSSHAPHEKEDEKYI